MIHPYLVHMLFCVSSYADIGGVVMIAGCWRGIQHGLRKYFDVENPRWPIDEYRDLAER